MITRIRSLIIKMHKYKVVPTKKQLNIIRLYWSLFKAEETLFWAKMGELEKKMSKETNIKELEFFNSDGDWCGVGNGSRTMKLLQRNILEK
jgi:hypothetical protein